MPPMVNLTRGRAPLDTRIRSIVQTEMQDVGFLRPADPTFRRTGFERGTAAGSQATADREFSGVLTPFGVYRSGPTGFLTVMVSLVSLVAAGALVLFLVPYRLGRTREALTRSPRQALRLEAIGVLAFVLSLALILLLVALVTGILFAVVVLVLLAVTGFAGLLAVALALGRWIRRRVAPRAGSPIADLGIGLLALFPLGLVPWLGWLFVLLLAALGFGALVATKFGSEEGWSLDALRGGAA
jgi:hypothetical protein